jgi:hypothetical protein
MEFSVIVTEITKLFVFAQQFGLENKLEAFLKKKPHWIF